MLWQAYRAHALALAGQTADALALAQGAVPMDVYEWVHIFECLLRVDKLHLLDLGTSCIANLWNPNTAGQPWPAPAMPRLSAHHFA